MKVLLLTLVLALSGCSAVPAPRQTGMVTVAIVGQVWTKDRQARAAYMARITATDKLPFFAEISLPNPDGDSPEIIRKRVGIRETAINADGQPRSHWVKGMIYYYGLKIYSDSQYSQLEDSVIQASRCIRPPDTLLDQLR